MDEVSLVVRQRNWKGVIENGSLVAKMQEKLIKNRSSLAEDLGNFIRIGKVMGD